MRTVASSRLRPNGMELQLEAFTQQDGQIIEGILRTPDASLWYPILQGVP